MRVFVSVLLALLGAVAGAASGVAITWALLSGAGENALVWAVTLGFFCVPLTLGGAVATGVLSRRGFRVSTLYGIAASFVVLVVVPVATIQFATKDTSDRNLLAGQLCKKPGIRYVGTPTQKVNVCFTLTADRSAHIEIGWRFGRASSCFGAASYSDSEVALDRPERIDEPGFTATIRGARASGVLEDPDTCAGKTFTWSARRAK